MSCADLDTRVAPIFVLTVLSCGELIRYIANCQVTPCLFKIKLFINEMKKVRFIFSSMGHPELEIKETSSKSCE